MNKITLGNYNIFAFESLHDINEQSLIYLIENNGKTIFYASRKAGIIIVVKYVKICYFIISFLIYSTSKRFFPL